MKTLVIDIIQDDIIGEVAKISSFVGSKEYQEGTPLYDAVRITEQETPLLTEHIASAKRILLSRFNRFAENTGAGMALLLPDEYPLHDDAIKKECRDFIVNYVASKWFEIAIKGRAEEYRQFATTNLVTLEREIYTRRKPAKKTDWTNNNIF